MSVPERVRAVVRLAWPAALVALGALALASAWNSWTVSLALLLAAVLPLAVLRIVLALGVPRWPATSVLLMLLVLTGYLLTAGAGLPFRDVVSDVVPRLLTSPQPYAVSADLLVGPLLLTGLASVVTGLRADSRRRVTPVVAAAVLYLAGALLTAGSADSTGIVAVLLLLVAVLGWVFLDEHDESWGPRLSVAGPLAIIGVGVLAAAALLPASSPFEPRTLVDPPLTDVVATSPLSSVSAWASDPGTELFHVTGPAVPLRLAVLDVYDGQQWTARPRFAAIGSVGEPGLPVGDTVSRSRVTVAIDDLDSGFVPTPGEPTSVTVQSPAGEQVLVDQRTGSLFAPGADDGRGLTYTVEAVSDAATSTRIESASVPSGPDVAAYTQLPGLPPDLAAYSARVVQGASTPYAQALAIQDRIRADNTLSAKAVSGSALWRVQSFLVGGPDRPGARVGSAEQFAAAFAVVARANGLPTRVVVGFRPGQDAGDGSRVVHGSDVLAWPEVYFAGAGWVPFSPTPDDDTFVREQPDTVQTPEATGTPVPSPALTAGATPGDRAGSRPPRTQAPASAWWLAVPVAAVLVLALGLLLARLVRRARQRRRGPAGAWAEVLDALRLSGRQPAAHHPADQVAADLDAAALSGTGTGTGAAARVAEQAQRSVFGPAEEQVTATTRSDVRTVTGVVRRSVPRWRRWFWHLDPRVFVRYRVTQRRLETPTSPETRMTTIR